MPYTAIDLFSGPGGLCTGFEWAGIKPLIAVEWSNWTVQTYSKSHNAQILELELYLNGELENEDSFFQPSDRPVLIHGDINKVSVDLIKNILKKRFDLESVDIVTGGAPCESFSMAGDRKEDDNRNELFMNILRIAHGVKSPMILFENVKGLFSKKYQGVQGKMFEYICDQFENTELHTGFSYRLASRNKYEVLLSATNFGVPQARERLFLVGVDSRLQSKFSYPRPTHGPNCRYDYVTVADALLDLPQIQSGEKTTDYTFELDLGVDDKRINYLKIMRGISKPVPKHIQFNGKSISDHVSVNHRESIQRRMELIRQGEGMKAAVERLIKVGKEDLVEKYFPKKIYAARNRRLNENTPSFTVTSHCLDEMIHPRLNRGLTPREAARLQSFPDWYIFEGPFVKFHSDPEQDRYEQIGDAIPPLLAYNLAVQVVDTLNHIYSEIGENRRLVEVALSK